MLVVDVEVLVLVDVEVLVVDVVEELEDVTFSNATTLWKITENKFLLIMFQFRH